MIIRCGQVSGFSGDGGTGTSGSLVQPGGLSQDAAGDLFIADALAQRVRSVIRVAGLAQWWTSDSTAGHGGATYAWNTITASPANLQRVTVTLPTGTTTGGAALGAVYGLPPGGTLSVAATTVTYTAPFPVSVDPGVRLYLSVTGLGNTAVSGAYASMVTTYDSSGTAVDAANAGALSIGAAGSFLPALPRTASATTGPAGPAGLVLTLSPSSAGAADRTADLAVSAVTDAARGYSLFVQSTSVTGTTGTLAALTGTVSAAVPAASFTVDRIGYTVTSMSGTGTVQGGLATGGYAGPLAIGSTTSGSDAVRASAPAAGDTAVVRLRARVDYLIPAGTYTATVSVVLLPAY
jgi:hypothetical protein